MRATQSIRKMNQRSTGLHSSHLSGLAEPKIVLDSAQSQADATLPEIVVTFRDVSSPLDDILAHREQGVPEYVSFGDQIAAPQMDSAEPTNPSESTHETRELSVDEDDYLDSMLSVHDATENCNGLLATELTTEATPPAREPAPTSLGNARAVDESLLDHLLGEITASFRGVDETEPRQRGAGHQPKVEHPQSELDANVGRTLEHEHKVVPTNDEQSKSSNETWSGSESSVVNADVPVDPSLDRCDLDSRSTRQDNSKSNGLTSHAIEPISTPCGDENDATELSATERSGPSTLDNGLSSNPVLALQWEPIPTATGPIDVRSLAWSSVIGIYRDDDASDESATYESATYESATSSDSNGEITLDATAADSKLEQESEEDDAASNDEYANVDLVDSLTSELTVVPRGTTDESIPLGHSDGLLSDLAKYNQQASSTDVDRNVRPVRAETNNISSQEFEAQYAQLVDTLCERTPGLSSPILMFGAADDLPLAPRCVQQIATELASRSTTRRVLLVDGRTRSRTLSQQLVSADAPGLAEALLEEENWADYVCATATPQLDFLPAGNGLLSICQPLEDRLTHLSIDWKASYDYVLIDGGDPNDVIPRLWCSMCDATYLLVTLGETETIAAKAAVTELRAYGARLLGCVVCAQPRD